MLPRLNIGADPIERQRDYINRLADTDILDALREYTDTAYEPINNDLMNKGKVETPVYAQFISRIDKAFAQVPPLSKPLVVYRGIKHEFSCGVFLGYFSTTERLSVALEFANRDAAWTYLLQINVPKGFRVLPLEKITKNHDEWEVLLPRNTNFRIDGFGSAQGHHVVLVTVVPTTDDDISKAMSALPVMAIGSSVSQLSDGQLLQLIVSNVTNDEIELFGLEDTVDSIIASLEEKGSQKVSSKIRDLAISEYLKKSTTRKQ